MEQRAQDHAGAARPPRRREPALDGIRALAVLAVVTFHGEAGWATGGFLGVDVFFVLSGFLITRLLLLERGETGQVDLRGFWGRRARRLLPALLVLIAGLVVLGLVIDLPAASLQTLPGDAVAALLFVANWRFLAGDHGYFASGQAPSLLEHTWSLSIEEQFYLLWAPLLAALAVVIGRRAAARVGSAGRPAPTSARRRTARTVLAVAVVGAAASATWMWFRAGTGGTGESGSSAYWDTLARLQGPLLGAALAVVLASTRATRLAERRRWLPGALAASGLVVLGFLVVRLDAGSDLLYPGGFLLAALATAAVIAGLHLRPAGAVARGLGWRPIAALGVISYGVYLWHWPMLVVVTGPRTGLSGVAVHAARLVATIAVAAASYVLVEKPVLRSRWDLRRTALTFAACGATVVVALALLLPRPDPASVETGLAIPGAEAFAAPPGVADDGVTVPGTDVPGTDVPAVTIAVPPRTSSIPTTTSAPPTTAAEVPATSVVTAPSTVPGPPVHISFFGDSVSDSVARALAPEGARYNTVVGNAAFVGCGVPMTGPYRLGGVEHEISGECLEWRSVWEQGIESQRPDVAVIVLGRHEVLDRQYEEHWTAIGDPTYDGYLVSQLHEAIDLLRQHGIPVVLTTAPFYVGPADPGGGIRPENAPARVHRFNQLLRTVAPDDPDVRIADLGALVSPGGTYAGSIDGVRIRSDGVHFAPEAGSWLAPRLLPQLVEVVR